MKVTWEVKNTLQQHLDEIQEVAFANQESGSKTMNRVAWLRDFVDSLEVEEEATV